MTYQWLKPHALSSTAWLMYRSMMGIGLVCGMIILFVYQWTAPIIQKNRSALLEQAIFQVLPQAKSKLAFYQSSTGQFLPVTDESAGESIIYASYGAQSNFMGLVIAAQGMGYQDRIALLYAYIPQRQRIVGLQILDSRETPGLGARIRSDPDFLANFVNLDVQLSDDQTSFVHPLQVVKAGQKKHPWQIDSMSGATVSSQAVADMVRLSAEQWIPLLSQHREDFEVGKQTD